MPQDFARESKLRRSGGAVLRHWIVCLPVCAFCVAAAITLAKPVGTAHAQVSSANANTWTVVIVLPPRVVAGYAATLAVLDVNGRLAPGITVDIGNNEHVTTDNTGRASFTAPSTGDVLIAKASGASAASLVDLLPASGIQQAAAKPAAPLAGGLEISNMSPTVSLHDRFPICIPGLRGEADANRVTINGQRAVVLAASPECIVVLPGPYSLIGSAKIAIDAAGKQWTANTTLVSLEFAAPNPPLVPGKKSVLTVEARGSNQPLRVIVENETPGVLRFRKGETQELVTKGGANNVAAMEVDVSRAGDFSFHARPLPAPDAETGRRYLLAAAPFAPKNLQHEIRHLADRLAHDAAHRSNDHSGNSAGESERIRLELQDILAATIPGDLRTLLSSAYSSL